MMMRGLGSMGWGVRGRVSDNFWNTAARDKRDAHLTTLWACEAILGSPAPALAISSPIISHTRCMHPAPALQYQSFTFICKL